ncbi:MAG: MBL fold metallo-hydrolase, partial [Thermoanaerobacteraceae bacterium]|nr:MBL fold metallo-hydrolase [Thermoanaerobacteraceae bacterium]
MFFKNGTRKNFYLKTVVSLLLTVILMLTATACNEANYITHENRTKIEVHESSDESTDNSSDDFKSGIGKEDSQENNQEETPNLTGTPSEVEGELKVHFLDVGQGDSILITTGSNAMLIDAGDRGYGSSVVSYLKKQGVKKLDYLILTHPHADHIGGAADVVKAFEIGKIIMPKVSHTTKTFENLLLTIQNKGLKITSPNPGDEYELGGARFKILAPNSSSYKSMNDHSVVTRIAFGNTAFLFTGDAESTSESQILSKGFDVKSDVLKVGHHGSKTSTTASFLKNVSPKYAVISVGKGNNYGHPTQEVLERLDSQGIKVYRTDEAGTIIATSDGTNITFDKDASSIAKSSSSSQGSSNSSTGQKSKSSEIT